MYTFINLGVLAGLDCYVYEVEKCPQYSTLSTDISDVIA